VDRGAPLRTAAGDRALACGHADADRTATQRAQETQTHPDTVRKLARRFRQQGMLGVLPAHIEVVIQASASKVPDAVSQEIARLKALYVGFHDRELAGLVACKSGYPIDDTTVKKLWRQSPVPCQGHLGLWDDHTHPDRQQARLQVIPRYYQGWAKVSIRRCWQVSRPTVDAWIERPTGERDQRGMAPHVTIPRRWYDDQGSSARTPAASDQRHQACIQTSHTTAHQGSSAISASPDARRGAGDRHRSTVCPGGIGPPLLAGPLPANDQAPWRCDLAPLPRRCRGRAPHTQVLRWVAGESLRAAFDHVVLAE
jgi:hypothetical protein